MFKRILALLAFVVSSCLFAGERNSYPADFKPTDEKVKYYDDEECYFDFWKSDIKKPAPLLIYIHGGGFTGGNRIPGKGTIKEIQNLQAKGIAFATLEYPKLPRAGSLLEILKRVRYFIQYMRANAEKYNIDKNHIVCFGGSAGAGSCLWAAVSDDAADPTSSDPVLRESSKPTAIRLSGSQSTYNFLRWPEVLHRGDEVVPLKRLNVVFRKDYKSVAELKNDAALMKEFAQMDMLALMDKNDPPIYVDMVSAESVGPDFDIIHHPLHGKAIYEQAKKVGIDCLHKAYTKDIAEPFDWMAQKLGLSK